MARIVVIGEAMLELSRAGANWRLGHAGDTLNSALHLARAGHDVAYLTAIGADRFSLDMKAHLAAWGIDTSLILTHPQRTVGLYAIGTDTGGERSFTYWRDQSAAREMFALDGIEDALARAGDADLILYSLISLAILPAQARKRLVEYCAGCSGRVAFDGNYRPRLWPDAEEARAARDMAIACADIGLPTLDDEMLLGTPDADAVAARWQALGCGETVVKLGAEGCRLPDGTIVPPPAVLQPVDTSGAGDAFNGGYLAARMSGLDLVEAAKNGHRLAGHVIMAPGAIPEDDKA